MTPLRAALHIDHHRAAVLQIDADEVQTRRIGEHAHYTRQHGSAVRTEHEFFGEVCDALAKVEHVLVLGSHTAQADFRHFVEKHRAAFLKRIVAWQTVDHPTDPELVAVARKYFVEHDGMAHTQKRM